jgi:hypothetical protein
VERRQTSASLAVSGSVSSLTIWMASSKGILVKRETTSKLIRVSWGPTFSFLMILIKSLESLMKESVWPTRGLRILATCLPVHRLVNLWYSLWV